MDYRKGEILYVEKPYKWTSFDVVAKIRLKICRKLGIRKLKVGHAGTLDPLATGVMIICTGKATKRIEEFQYNTKEYIATFKLGATTPSFDLEKEIDKEYDYSHVTREMVEETLTHFLGRIEQIPPKFSAVKVKGKRAYQYARDGEEVKLKPKVLVIDEIEMLQCDLPVVIVRIVCSKGTYIRAIARDLGEKLNCGSHLIGLQRTRIGDVTIKDCKSVDDLLEEMDAIESLTPEELEVANGRN